MKIGIIGCGNMGGAIARGLCASGRMKASDVLVSSPNRHGELQAVEAACPGIVVNTSNVAVASKADVLILAVKPWLLDDVMHEIAPSLDFGRQLLVSIVAGATTARLASFAGDKLCAVFELIPNIAIAQQQSMTFIAQRGATPEQVDVVKSIFSALGGVMVVEERLMAACTALSSCGIAYVMRYVRAAVEGGVELGLKPTDAVEIMLQTMQGAVAVLRATGDHPEAAIDRVTTPGGLTIKGLNAMEAAGFTPSVIAGLRASMPQG